LNTTASIAFIDVVRRFFLNQSFMCEIWIVRRNLLSYSARGLLSSSEILMVEAMTSSISGVLNLFELKVHGANRYNCQGTSTLLEERLYRFS
jgi:hypothetical protein